MKYPDKKITILVFAILILFFAPPKIANAGFLNSITSFLGIGGGTPAAPAGVPAGGGYPVIVTNPILAVESVSGGATAAATGASIGQSIFEWAFLTALETLKKQLLDMMVDQIVNWIQGGGDPKFITDWSGFFKDAADQAGGKFIQKLGLASLCSPIKPLLSASFIPITPFTTLSCTFSE